MRVDASTRLCVSLANPNGQTTAPVMHNAGFAELGVNFRYMAFEPDDIGEAIAAVRSLKLVGASVSKPFKEAVLPFLDLLDPVAAEIGAVNIVHNADGKLTGYNSDWIGATEALKEKCSLDGRRVAVLGAGGAARAAVYGLLRHGADVHIFNRSDDRGRSLAADLDATFGGPLERSASIEPEVLVNATPADVPVPDSIFESARTVMDMVVTRDKSRLLVRASSAGSEVVGGIRMLVLQGAFTFKLFTGLSAPVSTMQHAVETALGSKDWAAPPPSRDGGL